MHGGAIAVVAVSVGEAVIRQTDDEEVLPLWSLLQTLDELPQAFIQIGEGIGYRRGKALVRHIEGLMTA